MSKRPCKDDITAGDKQEDPNDGVATLGKHIEMYAVNNQAPQDLSKHVSESLEGQEAWYAELLKAWRNLKATPTPEEATELVFNTLKKIYYDCVDVADLEVDKNNVIDGRHFIVSVQIETFSVLPSKIAFAIIERRVAHEKMDLRRADDLLNVINTEDYQIMNSNTLEEVLTRKYKIRLRGFEDSGRLNEAEARGKLVKMVDGKCLMIKVFHIDEDLHCVGDAYREDRLLQKDLVMEGSAPCAWS